MIPSIEISRLGNGFLDTMRLSTTLCVLKFFELSRYGTLLFKNVDTTPGTIEEMC